MAHLRRRLAKIEDVVSSIQNGNGTIGKLLVDPTLYNSLQATVGQLQQLTATLNSKTDSPIHDVRSLVATRVGPTAKSVSRCCRPLKQAT